MTRLAACLVLLAFAFAPIAYAAEPTDSSSLATTAERPMTLAPLAPVTPLPTASLEVCDLGTCAEEDVTGTSFFLQPDPQVCMSYCASNNWTFLSYCDIGRGFYLCLCCSA